MGIGNLSRCQADSVDEGTFRGPLKDRPESRVDHVTHHGRSGRHVHGIVEARVELSVTDGWVVIGTPPSARRLLRIGQRHERAPEQ